MDHKPSHMVICDDQTYISDAKTTQLLPNYKVVCYPLGVFGWGFGLLSCRAAHAHIHVAISLIALSLQWKRRRERERAPKRPSPAATTTLVRTFEMAKYNKSRLKRPKEAAN